MTRARVVALAAVLAACASRTTITPTQGVSYRAMLEAQTANPASKARPPKGLDAQESSVIAQSYVKSLAPKAEEAKDSGLIILSPQRQNAPQALMPSVPK